MLRERVNCCATEKLSGKKKVWVRRSERRRKLSLVSDFPNVD